MAQRPVSWVLWSTVAETAVVVIPEEAEIVLRMARARRMHSGVHLITYASPVTRRMLPFNSLSFFSTPPLPDGWVAPAWLKTELGLLAGRLYFTWDEYEALCAFLGVVVDDNSNLGALIIEEDDDIDEDYEMVDEEDGVAEEVLDDTMAVTVKKNREEAALRKARSSAKKNNSFAPRPLTFLQEWLAIRRHGQDFVHTPMGFLTQGKPLQANHPFFTETSAATATANGGAAQPLGAGHGRANSHGYGPMGDGQADYDEVDLFDGVDDMGANVGDGEGADEGGDAAQFLYDSDEESI